MRLTSKGQVTIPKPIRDQLGLLPGTPVEFEVEGEAVRIAKTAGAPGRGAALIGRMRRGSGGDVHLSTDEIMALTRGED